MKKNIYKCLKKLCEIICIRKWEFCVLGISLIFVILNVAWLYLDTEEVFWDDGWYLETSVNIYNALTHHGFASFLITFENALRIKAPLITLLPLPFYFIFGKSLASAYVSVLFLIPIANIYLYRLAIQFVSKTSAIISIFFLNSLPIVLSISRQFMVEYLEMTLIIMWVYYLLKSDYFRIKKYTIILGVIGGLGMLTKVVFPMFILVPTLIIIIQRIFTDDKKKVTKKLLRDLAPTISLMIGIASIWYVYNALHIGWYLFANSYGSVAKNYSNGPALDIGIILLYLRDLNNYGFSFYFITLFFVSLSIFLFLVVRKKIALTREQKIFLGILSGWFFFPFLNNSLAVTKCVRWMTPAMPAFILLLIFFLDGIFKKIKFKKTQTTLYLFLSFFALFQAFYGSFQLTKLGNMDIVYNNIFIFRKNTEEFIDYLHVPQKISFSHKDIIDTIMKNREGSQEIKNVLIATEDKNINFNNFQYFANLHGAPLNFYSGGTAQDSKIEIAKSKFDKADFIIYTSNIPSDFLNTVNVELKKIIEKNGSLIPVGTFTPSNGSGIVYRKRT